MSRVLRADKYSLTRLGSGEFLAEQQHDSLQFIKATGGPRCLRPHQISTVFKVTDMDKDEAAGPATGPVLIHGLPADNAACVLWHGLQQVVIAGPGSGGKVWAAHDANISLVYAQETYTEPNQTRAVNFYKPQTPAYDDTLAFLCKDALEAGDNVAGVLMAGYLEPADTTVVVDAQSRQAVKRTLYKRKDGTWPPNMADCYIFEAPDNMTQLYRCFNSDLFHVRYLYVMVERFRACTTRSGNSWKIRVTKAPGMVNAPHGVYFASFTSEDEALAAMGKLLGLRTAEEMYTYKLSLRHVTAQGIRCSPVRNSTKWLLEQQKEVDGVRWHRSVTDTLDRCSLAVDAWATQSWDQSGPTVGIENLAKDKPWYCQKMPHMRGDDESKRTAKEFNAAVQKAHLLLGQRTITDFFG